jgi:hypothetical protein
MDETASNPLVYFYLMPKLHKLPLLTQPICSDCGSLPHGLGQWIDQVLQAVVKDHDSYFRNSFELKKLLDPLRLPQNVSLFTYYAVSMYTKIDTEECINRLGDFLKLPAITEFYSIHPKARIKAIKLVIRTHPKSQKEAQRAAECQKELERAKNSKKNSKLKLKEAKKSKKSKTKGKKAIISKKKQKNLKSTTAQNSQAEPRLSPLSLPWPLQPLIFAKIFTSCVMCSHCWLPAEAQ